jgi:hypothetical protein
LCRCRARRRDDPDRFPGNGRTVPSLRSRRRRPPSPERVVDASDRHGHVVGSLNIYSHHADAFDDHAHDTALVMAAEVAHALVRSAVLGTVRTTRDRLQEEHDEMTLVSRAQGVLVALHDCSVAQARDLIRNAADSNSEQLRVTAERILATVRDDTEATATLDRDGATGDRGG